jgi:hypothetical protein
MINDSLKALDLLREAHETLAGQITPTLTGEHRYGCLMIANALRIVERHFRVIATQEDSGLNPSEEIDGKALVASIRAGRFDTGTTARGAMVNQLRNRLYRQLAVNDPRSLHTLNSSSD